MWTSKPSFLNTSWSKPFMSYILSLIMFCFFFFRSNNHKIYFGYWNNMEIFCLVMELRTKFVQHVSSGKYTSEYEYTFLRGISKQKRHIWIFLFAAYFWNFFSKPTRIGFFEKHLQHRKSCAIISFKNKKKFL